MNDSSSGLTSKKKKKTWRTQHPNTETKCSYCFCQDSNSQPKSPRTSTSYQLSQTATACDGFKQFLLFMDQLLFNPETGSNLMTRVPPNEPWCSVLSFVYSFFKSCLCTWGREKGATSVAFKCFCISRFYLIQTPREHFSENPQVLYLNGLKRFNSPQLQPFTSGFKTCQIFSLGIEFTTWSNLKANFVFPKV